METKKDESYQRLHAIDWCAALMDDPAYQIATIKPPPRTSELEGALLGKTLHTEDTIRATLCLYKVEAGQIVETIMLWDIGTGLNGLPQAAHGGMIATFLDEACGILVSALVGASSQDLLQATGKDSSPTIWPSNKTATIYLNVTYLKFVTTPSVIAARARLKQRSGRKLFVNGQIEDKNGDVLAKVESLFVVRREASI